MSQLIVHKGTYAAIMDAIEQHPNLASSTKRKYTRAIERYTDDTGRGIADFESLKAHAASLSPTGRAHLKAAVRLWAKEAITQVQAMSTPENQAQVNAMIHRLTALQKAIKVKTPTGQKVHTWLTAAEVKRLLGTAGDDMKGKRDRIALGLLVAAGLRRNEACELAFSDVKLQPVKGKIRTVLQVEGKGAKNRIVPIKGSLAAALDDWQSLAPAGLPILRSVDRFGVIGNDLSPVGLFDIVRQAGASIGKPELAPHDLRRTYAQIGYDSGIPITQISKLLGHASVTTTQRYLNLELDLETTISDFVPF